MMTVRGWRRLVSSPTDCNNRVKLELRAWNLRIVQELCWMVNDKRPNLVLLMETKAQKKKMENIRIKLTFPNMFIVESVGKSEGLVLFWEDGCDVEIQNYSNRHINATIHNHQLQVDWKFTSFYGHPDVTRRIEARNLLKALTPLSLVPWMCIGDVNEILTVSEKVGGLTRQQNQMRAFQQTLEFCGLTDLGFVGPKFTWSNCQEGDAFIKERLDRRVANFAWKNFFPEAEIAVEATICSDHLPLYLHLTKPHKHNHRKPRFFYEASWGMETGC